MLKCFIPDLMKKFFIPIIFHSPQKQIFFAQTFNRLKSFHATLMCSRLNIMKARDMTDFMLKSFYCAESHS